MGTWNMVPPDEYAPLHPDEKRIVESLKLGIELGMTLIDTSAMYGGGRAEQLVGQAIKGARDRVFIATKVEPSYYSFEGILIAAQESCRRLGTDYIDLYQFHWPSMVAPIKELMKAMERLVDDGIVRFIGVSNFSKDELIQAQNVMSKYPVVSNQVRYNILSREIEGELLPYAEQEGVTIIAYSPFAVGAIFGYQGPERETLEQLADQYNKSIAQICLNWLISKKSVITIPKAVKPEHIRENAEASDWRMSPESYKAIDRAFAFS